MVSHLTARVQGREAVLAHDVDEDFPAAIVQRLLHAKGARAGVDTVKRRVRTRHRCGETVPVPKAGTLRDERASVGKRERAVAAVAGHALTRALDYVAQG